MPPSMRLLGGLFVTILLIAHAPSTSAQQSATRSPVPVEPIGAIIDAFQSHTIVGLSDAHGNEQNHVFRLSLIRDPRFAATVNDIVIELGNARYQDLMDRYIHGNDVQYEALRKTWQDTTVPTAGNNYTMMQQFVEAVRAVNAPLPRERQLRVLLGDPPIDWDQVHTRDDHRKWIEMRDTFPAALIQWRFWQSNGVLWSCTAVCTFREGTYLVTTNGELAGAEHCQPAREEYADEGVYDLAAGSRTAASRRRLVAGSKSRDNPWDQTRCGRLHALLSVFSESLYCDRREDRTDSARAVALTVRRRPAGRRAVSWSGVRDDEQTVPRDPCRALL
jgi:hypothetical protein